MGELATLLYTYEELEVLANLVDAELNDGSAMNSQARFGILNSLRTSLREAQYTLQPTHTSNRRDVISRFLRRFET